MTKHSYSIIPDITGNYQENRDERGRFTLGVSGNPQGRPAGVLSFKTKWLNFISQLSKDKNITLEELDKELFMVAMRKLKNGDYQFWKDINDRVYGTAQHNVDVTSDVQLFGGSFESDIEDEEGVATLTEKIKAKVQLIEDLKKRAAKIKAKIKADQSQPRI